MDSFAVRLVKLPGQSDRYICLFINRHSKVDKQEFRWVQQARCGQREVEESGLHAWYAYGSDLTWNDLTWPDMTWPDMTWLIWPDLKWPDLTWPDMTWLIWPDLTHTWPKLTKTDLFMNCNTCYIWWRYSSSDPLRFAWHRPLFLRSTKNYQVNQWQGTIKS